MGRGRKAPALLVLSPATRSGLRSSLIMERCGGARRETDPLPAPLERPWTETGLKPCRGRPSGLCIEELLTVEHPHHASRNPKRSESCRRYKALPW